MSLNPRKKHFHLKFENLSNSWKFCTNININVSMFFKDKNDIFVYIYLELFPRGSFISIVLNKYLVRTVWCQPSVKIKIQKWWWRSLVSISCENYVEYWLCHNKLTKINKTCLITFPPLQGHYSDQNVISTPSQHSTLSHSVSFICQQSYYS